MNSENRLRRNRTAARRNREPGLHRGKLGRSRAAPHFSKACEFVQVSVALKNEFLKQAAQESHCGQKNPRTWPSSWQAGAQHGCATFQQSVRIQAVLGGAEE